MTWCVDEAITVKLPPPRPRNNGYFTRVFAYTQITCIVCTGVLLFFIVIHIDRDLETRSPYSVKCLR